MQQVIATKIQTSLTCFRSHAAIVPLHHFFYTILCQDIPSKHRRHNIWQFLTVCLPLNSVKLKYTCLLRALAPCFVLIQ